MNVMLNRNKFNDLSLKLFKDIFQKKLKIATHGEIDKEEMKRESVSLSALKRLEVHLIIITPHRRSSTYS